MAMLNDVVARMKMDPSLYVKGIRDAQNVTTDFQRTTQRSMIAAGGASAGKGGGAAMGIGQLAFAAQDFTSVLEMGGRNALGRALMSTANNVQMLGMAFGPVGLAITAVGGALAAVLIPKMIESLSLFGEMTASAEAFVAGLGKVIDRSAHMTQLGGKIEKTNTMKELAGMQGDVDSREKIALDELEIINSASRKLKREKEGMLASVPQGPKIAWGFAEWLTNAGIQTDVSEMDAQIAKVDKMHKAANDKLRSVQKEKDLLGAPETIGSVQAREEFDKRFKLNQEDFKQREQLAHAERQKQLAFANTTKEQTETPVEKARRKTMELAAAFARGDIDKGTFDKAGDQLIKDMHKGTTDIDRKVSPLLEGSSEAFSAVQKAIREAMGGEKKREEIEIAKKQLIEAEKMATLQKQIKDAFVKRPMLVGF